MTIMGGGLEFLLYPWTLFYYDGERNIFSRYSW